MPSDGSVLPYCACVLWQFMQRKVKADEAQRQQRDRREKLERDFSSSYAKRLKADRANEKGRYAFNIFSRPSCLSRICSCRYDEGADMFHFCRLRLYWILRTPCTYTVPRNQKAWYACLALCYIYTSTPFRTSVTTKQLRRGLLSFLCIYDIA